MHKLIQFTLFMLISSSAIAETFVLPPDDINIVGRNRLITAKGAETLPDIAREYKVGYEEIVKANPSVDRWNPGEGTPVVIPGRYILPNTPREGLILNLPEMRLYYYPEPAEGEARKVITFPVGIGRMDWETPRGKTYVSEMKKNPTWTPPESIKKEHLEKGDPLPDVVPAGPNNPLGTRAMRLGIPSYLIHGTNKPYGVGMRVSHGCIRMRQEDIEALFNFVRVKDTVHIINQPLKIGRFAGSLFMEFHKPLEEDGLSFEQNYQNALNTVHQALDNENLNVQSSLIQSIVKEESGLPVEVLFTKK